MTDIEWREITWDNVHEHIGKPVRVRGKRSEISGMLSWANETYFDISGALGGDGFDWDKYGLYYAWYPAYSNITLTEPGDIKRFIENMDEKGVGKYDY